MNLVRNYSPHLSPNVRSAKPTAELRNILLAEAKEKLDGFLRRWRSRKRAAGVAGIGSSSSVAVLGKKAMDPSMVVSYFHVAERIFYDKGNQVVDTVLVKLYAESQKTQELYTLIQEPNQVVLLEVEPVLKSRGQYKALCMLYEQQGEDLKLLELWAGYGSSLSPLCCPSRGCVFFQDHRRRMGTSRDPGSTIRYDLNVGGQAGSCTHPEMGIVDDEA